MVSYNQHPPGSARFPDPPPGRSEGSVGPRSGTARRPADVSEDTFRGEGDGFVVELLSGFVLAHAVEPKQGPGFERKEFQNKLNRVSSMHRVHWLMRADWFLACFIVSYTRQPINGKFSGAT